jgi:hypothetical protein
MLRWDAPGPGRRRRLRAEPAEQLTLLHLPSGRVQGRHAERAGHSWSGSTRPGTHQGKTVVHNTTGFAGKTVSIFEKLTQTSPSVCAW